MNKPHHSANKHINNLIEFRQAIYQHGFTTLKDAQFELVDALLMSGPVRSFPELSLCPVFRRRWSSAYAAIEEGRQDLDWLRRYLCAQAPTHGVQVFALDTTAWPRPSAPTLADRQYVRSPTAAIDGSSIVAGYPYSLLSWVAKERSSWALPVDIERVRSSQNPVDVGVAQVRRLCQARGGFDGSDVIVGDGGYMFGNPTPAHFLCEAMDLPILTIILNNGMWGAVRRATLSMYQIGRASRRERV